MPNKEWAENALHDFQASELPAVERVKKAEEAMEAARIWNSGIGLLGTADVKMLEFKKK